MEAVRVPQQARNAQTDAQLLSDAALSRKNCLTSLQLVAVQPVVLRCHTETPLHHQHEQQQQQHEQQAIAADLEHHELLLQFQASVCPVPPPLPQQQPLAPSPAAALNNQQQQVEVAAITAGATPSSCQLLPLPLEQAVLQICLLNRHMQVLLHKQYSLEQLLQEGGGGGGAGTSSASRTTHAGSASDQLHMLNIQLSAPSQPSAHMLDALHLFVTLCSAQLEDPLAVGGAGEPQPACLVAELPLLVMPAQAQQEVQQRLLPAMRQDVQTEQQDQLEAEQQDQQQQEQQLRSASSTEIAARAMQVERAVWQHFNQLALDILLIMQLSEAVRAEAAQAAGLYAGPAGAAASSAVASSQPLSPSTAAAAAAHALAGAPTQQQQQQQQDWADPDAALHAGTAMDNLRQAVDTLLLPLLLPYMTAHGLHSTLQVILQCLPPQLQLQQHWQQQQLARLEALTAAQQQQAPPPPGALLPATSSAPTAGAAATAASGGGVGVSGGAVAAAGASAPSHLPPALVVLPSSAVLDTPATPPAAADRSSAPAGAEYDLSTSSESLYESGRSSPTQDWDGEGGWEGCSASAAAATTVEQQEQEEAEHVLSGRRPRSSSSRISGERVPRVGGDACFTSMSDEGQQRSSGRAGGGGGSGGDFSRAEEAAPSGRSSGASGSGGDNGGGDGGGRGVSSSSGMRRRGPVGSSSSTHGQQSGITANAGGMRSGDAAAATAAPGSDSGGGEPGDDGGQGGGAGGSSSNSGSRGSSALSAAIGMPCWLVPFKQFPELEMERRYVAYKHKQLLYLDALGGVYQLAVAAALTKHSLFQHPMTWVLLMLTIVKALPHVPLLLGLRQQHIRYRELWIFLVSPCIGIVLCFLMLFTTAWQPASMPPIPLAYRSFWHMHGELFTALLRSFFQHMRLRPFCIYTAVDRVISMQLWAPWSGAASAVARSTLAGVLSVVVCWALDLYFRRRFVLAGLHHHQPVLQAQRLA